MGPLLHIGLTVGLLVGSDVLGYHASPEIIAATVAGGTFLDGDKVFEMIDNRRRAKKGLIPDITARWRILHSIFAFVFGLALGWFVLSWIPFFAVLLHVLADSFIPGFEKDGKNYPSHSPLKWIAIPFIERSWKLVVIGWPVTYPPKMNWIYNRLAPMFGLALLALSVCYWLL